MRSFLGRGYGSKSLLVAVKTKSIIGVNRSLLGWNFPGGFTGLFYKGIRVSVRVRIGFSALCPRFLRVIVCGGILIARSGVLFGVLV